MTLRPGDTVRVRVHPKKKSPVTERYKATVEQVLDSGKVVVRFDSSPTTPAAWHSKVFTVERDCIK